MILDFIRPELSHIKYIIEKFPDGQQNIIINKNSNLYEHDVLIKTRITSFLDIELLYLAVNTLRYDCNVNKISVYISYLLGARSDRKFGEYSCNYMKHVITPVINNLNLTKVIIFDPHSNVTEALINNYENQNNYVLLDSSFYNLFSKQNIIRNKITIVSPDKGSYEKSLKVADVFGVNSFISCNKIRKNNDILITLETCEYIDGCDNFVIVDDIGDGFGTFIKVAEKLEKSFPNSNKFLILSHVIQKKGAIKALKHFNKIYTTNSYSDFELENLIRYYL